MKKLESYQLETVIGGKWSEDFSAALCGLGAGVLSAFAVAGTAGAAAPAVPLIAATTVTACLAWGAHNVSI